MYFDSVTSHQKGNQECYKMVLLKLVCGGCEEIMLVKVFESVAETSFDKRMSQEEVSYAEVINWSEMVVTKFTPAIKHNAIHLIKWDVA